LESLGAHLKQEREKRKITLEEISLSTKIGTRFLIAIEEENFDQLPGGIFNKGFVKAYARSVGVDEAEAVAEYELATGANLPEPLAEGGPASEEPGPAAETFLANEEDEEEEDPGNGASRIPWEWFAAALLIVAFGFALWGYHSRERSSKPRTFPAVMAENSVAASPRAQAATAETTTTQASPGMAPSQTAAGEAAAVPSTTEASGKTEPPPSDSTAPGRAPRPASATSDSAPNPASPGAFLVQIKAREDSWVAISADGRQIMESTLFTAAEKSIGARDQVVIKTGNAGALDISFNGKKLPAPGGPNEVKTLTFDPHGPRF
jgi:cytoskeleton protein RodZ